MEIRKYEERTDLPVEYGLAWVGAIDACTIVHLKIDKIVNIHAISCSQSLLLSHFRTEFVDIHIIMGSTKKMCYLCN